MLCTGFINENPYQMDYLDGSDRWHGKRLVVCIDVPFIICFIIYSFRGIHQTPAHFRQMIYQHLSTTACNFWIKKNKNKIFKNTCEEQHQCQYKVIFKINESVMSSKCMKKPKVKNICLQYATFIIIIIYISTVHNHSMKTLLM